MKHNRTIYIDSYGPVKQYNSLRPVDIPQILTVAFASYGINIQMLLDSVRILIFGSSEIASVSVYSGERS